MPSRGACGTRRPRCSAFNEVFWDEASGFYAYTLDGDKQQVLTVASNPGHLPVVRDRPGGTRRARGDAADAAGHEERLGDPHAVGQHAAYNPYNYQNGSVWPHDNA